MGKAKSRDPSAAQTEEASRMLKAVADLDRLKIINALRGGPKNVGELAKILGAEIVNVSHHLGVLRRSKIVKNDKKGRFRYYILHSDNYKVSDKGESLTLGPCRLEMGK
jgi:ArsR family transcriptional regulator